MPFLAASEHMPSICGQQLGDLENAILAESRVGLVFCTARGENYWLWKGPHASGLSQFFSQIENQRSHTLVSLNNISVPSPPAPLPALQLVSLHSPISVNELFPLEVLMSSLVQRPQYQSIPSHLIIHRHAPEMLMSLSTWKNVITELSTLQLAARWCLPQRRKEHVERMWKAATCIPMD